MKNINIIFFSVSEHNEGLTVDRYEFVSPFGYYDLAAASVKIR